MNIHNEVLIRLYTVLVLIVLVAVLIFGKAVKITFFEGDKWRAKGERETLKYMPTKAERGSILAMDGSPLATSLPFFEIRFDLKADGLTDDVWKKNVDSLAHCLATYVDNSRTVGGWKFDLDEYRKKGERYVLIKKDVSFEELRLIQKFPIFDRGRNRGGFIVLRQPKRQRPFNMLARRTIGFVRDSTKTEPRREVGLEGRYNKVLSGKQGKQLMQKLDRGVWIPVNDESEIMPSMGNDIVTTLDIDLQQITNDALIRGLEYHQADEGIAVVMDVETGAIRAIANLQHNEERTGWYEGYNDAIGSAVEPGSTFKLAPMMALLEDNKVDLNKQIPINKGKMQFYEEEMLDASKKSFTIDSTSMRKAFAISSNVGIANQIYEHYRGKDAAGNLRANQFVKRLQQFHLHQRTGVEIIGEPTPFIKNPESNEDNWSGTTLPWMSIGYELTITPLQLLTFYNAVANDGQMMKPYLVSNIEHLGETIETFKPTVIDKQIASKATIAKAQKLLEEVIEVGTAEKIASKQIKLAGKTGTAQINYRKFDNRKNLKYRASFVGYFPADKPKYSCIVMVTNPRVNGYYGGDVAGPIFREIADKTYASKIDLHQALNSRPKPRMKSKKMPDLNIGEKEDMKKVLTYLELPYTDEGKTNMTAVSPSSDTLRLQNRTIKENVVPNVVGMGLRDALFVLENKGLEVEINGVGKVQRQSIRPGTKARGQTIKLTLN